MGSAALIAETVRQLQRRDPELESRPSVTLSGRVPGRLGGCGRTGEQ